MSKTAKRVKFEEAMRRLEQIVEAVEKGDIGIEESIEKYEEAMALVTQCRAILSEAEARIRKIQTDAQGQVKLTPMEEPEVGGNEA